MSGSHQLHGLKNNRVLLKSQVGWGPAACERASYEIDIKKNRDRTWDDEALAARARSIVTWG